MNDISKNQMTIFDFITDDNRKDISINNKIRLIELFAGYGSQAMALETLGADFEHYRVVEFDKYAIKSYNAVHDTDFPTMDITEVHAEDLNIVDTDKYTYLMTYSFPCTDLSVAGKGLGMSRDSGTRSGLLWEVERILKEIVESNGELPQILFMENVPQVHSKKNMDDFQEWIDFLTSIGYSSAYKDLNAKNYGMAQNRNRTFMVSFLNADASNYEFPVEIELTKVMKDYLENEVEDKYYITSEKARQLIEKLILEGKILTGRQADRQTIDLSINKPRITDRANCLSAHLHKDGNAISNRQQETNGVCETIRVNQVGYIEHGTGKHQSNTVYEANGLSPSITTIKDGGTQQIKILDTKKLKIRQATKDGFVECEVPGVADLNYPSSNTRRGRVIEGGQVSPTLTTENIPSLIEFGNEEFYNFLYEIDGEIYLIRIRKLIPLECLRLMGVSDENARKILEVNSNTQAYKQAGNSIVVNCLVALFSQLGIQGITKWNDGLKDNYK